MASSEFTFVHPLSANPITSSGYNIDCQVPQNVFSPINYTLPTTIQFPTPSASSVPFGGSSFGSCIVEVALNPATCNVTHVPWSNGCAAPSPPSFTLCSEVSMLNEHALMCPELNHTSSVEMSNLHLGKFSCDIQSQTRCKRKAVDIPEDCWIPTKIHINEERMSACMNDLRLDNNNIGAQPNFENEMWYSQDAMGIASLGEQNCRFGLNQNSRIELCRELQLGMKSKEILPKVVLDEVVKSSMQVVLWKPPECFGPSGLNDILEGGKVKKNDGNSNTEDESSSNSAFETNPAEASLMFANEWLHESDLLVIASDTVVTVNECEEMDL